MEHDSLGERHVPENAYYGIQSLRAHDNFQLSGIPLHHFPNLIVALATVKKACATTNEVLGLLESPLRAAICDACDEIIDGKLHHEFKVDMLQGGAGTSTNMNANEVIANRALELMGHQKGDYKKLHPNNHVNLSQSTNDVYPTTIRLAVLLSYPPLLSALTDICATLDTKAKEFARVIKLGRTQLQDAVPMTLGQEFNACKTTLTEDIRRLEEVAALFKEINLGATAIGTGINSHPSYAATVVETLSSISDIDFVLSPDLIEATSDTGVFVTLSSTLRRVAIKVSKFCNDLRLLASGPKGGLNEINLPKVQPGSSIMPGKVNPVIPEAVNQVAYHVIGNDLSVTMSAEAGQLQLNAMEPLIAFSLLDSMQLMTRALVMLNQRCLSGITANIDNCLETLTASHALVTALSPYLGYEMTSDIAREAHEKKIPIRELVLKKKLMCSEQLDDILNPWNNIRPRQII